MKVIAHTKFVCLIFMILFLFDGIASAEGEWATDGNNIHNANSGNVGIGTTNPDNAQSWNKVLNLHGQGHAKLLVTESSGVKTGIFSHAGYNGKIGTESNHNLTLTAGYWNDVMTLTTAGNVGIGTKNPDNAQSWNKVLNLHGQGHAKLLVTESSGVKTGIFSHAGYNGKIGTESNHNLTLTAGYWNDVMTLTTAGNVGIGTTNPDNAQSWNKVLNLHGQSHAKFLVTESGGVKTGIFSHAGYNGKIGTESHHNLTLTAGYWNDVMTLTTAGNVGVGTTSPQSKLSVNGTITAKEVKVTNTGWSDFIFEDNYKLASLASVESYIKKNRHLPDIPSAKEVEQQGLAISEMLAKQMQKIEEMTLYLIELKKENEDLRSEVEMLKDCFLK